MALGRTPRTRFALGLVSGGVALVLVQTLAPAGASAVDPPRALAVSAPADAAELLPNLVVLPATDVHVQRAGGERRLRFESALGNIGDGPIEVRPNERRSCPRGQHHATQVVFRDVDLDGRYRRTTDTDVSRRSAGCMVFHRYHDHWHFEAASRYTLFRASSPERSKVARRKMSFCLRDSKPVPARYDVARQGEFYGNCSRRSPQGISVGWADVYQSFLAGQAIRLPRRMGDGLYCLQIMVDPRNMLAETDEGDNTSLRAFALRGDRVSYRKVQRCR